MIFDAPEPASPAASPIADLSYRSYDGPLNTHAFRWWIVAQAGIRMNLSKRPFWILLALGAMPFILVALMMYLQSMSGMPTGNPFTTDTEGQKYASQFFRAMSNQTIFLFVLALLVGAGSIASDNAANALLVYLAKPITKGDYLLGKWMSVFVLVFAAAAIPALVLYLYSLMVFYSKGFLRDEPWLILRVLGAAAVPAVLHASLLTGISAWSKNGRLAGAAYAALYFLSMAVSTIFVLARYGGDATKGVLAAHLSIRGLILGLGQNIYGVTTKKPNVDLITGTMGFKEIPGPNPWILLGILAALCLLGIVAARVRIRAVEVVKG